MKHTDERKRLEDAVFEVLYKSACAKSRITQMKEYVQHGKTSTLAHSVAVAYYSYRVARCLKFMGFKEKELIRGALLHDYYLYDWHCPPKLKKLHGFSHPQAALDNAKADFLLSDIEKDVIKRHMFPLTLVPPKYKESVLVCIVDKICSVYETMSSSAYKNNRVICSQNL